MIDLAANLIADRDKTQSYQVKRGLSLALSPQSLLYLLTVIRCAHRQKAKHTLKYPQDHNNNSSSQYLHSVLFLSPFHY